MANINQKQSRRSKAKNTSAIKIRQKWFAPLNLFEKSRRALSMFFIYALIAAPLLLPDIAIQKVNAQTNDGCSSAATPQHIFQYCSVGVLRAELEAQAIDDVIKFHKLPNTSAEKDRVRSYARNEVRAFLFARFLALLKKPNPTPAEQDGINSFLARMKQRRILAAQKALDYYNDWRNRACTGFEPPAPYTYERSAACYGIGGYFAGPTPPTFEEFQQFGAVVAYGDLMTPQAQDVSALTTQLLVYSAGSTAAIAGLGTGIALGSLVSFGTISAIAPFAGSVVTYSATGVPTLIIPAASANSGAIGSGIVAGPVAVLILALTVAVMRGITVANESQLPGKLQDALTQAQNDNFNQFSFTYDDISNQQIYSEFLAATLPDFPGTGTPAATPNDNQFTFRYKNETNSSVNPSIGFVGWDGYYYDARLSGGWFVVRSSERGGDDKQSLSIKYLDWNNQQRVATRSGAQFIVTDPQNFNGATLTDELQFKASRLAGSAQYASAKIKFQQINVVMNPQIDLNCNFNNGFSATLGTVTSAGDLPSNLAVKVNDQTTATVNGITLGNLTVNDQYEIVGTITAPGNLPLPTAGDFTIKVSNSLSSATQILTLKKTAIENFISGETYAAVNVGQSFEKQIQGGSSTIGSCNVPSNFTIDGELPPGTSFAAGPLVGYYNVSGTPTTGGRYVFTVNKNYQNGETLSRSFTIFVNSELTRAPDYLQSWWRGDDSAEDFNRRRNGEMIGAASFTDGKIRRGFKFTGANGYVKLPNDTFEPNRAFTFETWFKTRSSGTILGQQASVPYQNSTGGSQLINVTPNGFLRARMFGGGEIISTRRVDDGAFHHLAVTYNAADNSRALYLDGIQIGTASGVGYRLIGAQYQFGTGVIEGTAQYANFSGVIDDPALYAKVLTAAEIASIYRSGSAGKMSIETLTTPTLTNTGTLKINARGGEGVLKYSIDNGATFKDTAEFLNLAPRTYNVVIKDGADRILRTTAAVAYAQPGFNVRAISVNPRCNNAATGTITVDPGVFTTGGNGTISQSDLPLVYSLDGGATTQSSNVFVNLAPGNYTPWVKHQPSNTIGTGAPVTLINPPPLALNPSNFVNSAAVGFSYDQQFQVAGGTIPITVATGQLPPGLFIITDTDGGTGRFAIRGTPTQTGTFPITVTASDGNSCPLTQTITLTVYDRNCRQVTVQNNNDSGAGSLRQAIADACSDATINIPASVGQITLSSPIIIDKSLNIAGDNPNFNVISGNDRTRLFETAANTTVNFTSVTLTGGNAGNEAAGALANRGTTVFSNSVIVGNRSFSGGAFYNLGTLGIYSSSVVNNFASGNSGAVANNPNAELIIRNSTIANNSSNGAGGAIYNLGTLSAVNATVAQNRSNADGVTDNNGVDGGGLLANNSETLINTIIAGNFQGSTSAQAASDISGTIETAEYNLVGNSASAGGILNGANGNRVGNNGAGTIPINTIINPTLALNNGFTPNFALAANSPALDKGRLYDDFTRVQFSDQRGKKRPVDDPAIPNAAGGNASDIGAFEAQAAPPADSLSISGRITNGGQGLQGVLVVLLYGSATVYTDANGDYSFTGLTANRSYEVAPTLNGYSFGSQSLSYQNMTANVTGADFVTATTTYEGDIAGRPTGNGTIDVLDLVALGRILGNLDPAPQNGGEFQRADTAPLNLRGDGALNVQDLVQLSRFTGSLDPVTPASGAAQPVNSQNPSKAAGKMNLENNQNVTGGNLLTDDALNRRGVETSDFTKPAAANLSVGTATVNRPNAIVPIRLNSNADTAAIQFTVIYDPAKLSIPSDAANSAIANRFPDTTFIINNRTPGRLGIVAYRPLDGTSTFPAGDLTLFEINFTVAAGATGATTVGFGGDPVPLNASNPQAGPVSVASAPGTINITLAPTAAMVAVGGRLQTSDGRGISEAVVYLTDAAGTTKRTIASVRGEFRFDSIPAGTTVVIDVSHKSYFFEPTVVTLNEDVTDLKIVGINLP